METDSFVIENDHLASYLDGINDNLKSDEMGNDFFETEKETNVAATFSNKGETDVAESNGRKSSIEQNTPFLSSFLIELIRSIKNTLISIQSMSGLSADRLNDVEFRKYAQRNIAEDIKKIDSVLNSLLNYIHINTPIIKTNTISIILEEVLEANEKQLQGKKIKIFKKCEKDLPETFIHGEQVKFILNSILQYAILSTPLNGTIGFLIKSFDFQNEGPDKRVSPERNGGYIEAAIGFMCEKKGVDQLKDNFGIPHVQQEETSKLILQLVKEILQKNKGSMTHEVDPNKPRALITLRFPIERRKVIYYEPINI